MSMHSNGYDLFVLKCEQVSKRIIILNILEPGKHHVFYRSVNTSSATIFLASIAYSPLDSTKMIVLCFHSYKKAANRIPFHKQDLYNQLLRGIEISTVATMPTTFLRSIPFRTLYSSLFKKDLYQQLGRFYDLTAQMDVSRLFSSYQC